MNKLRGKKYVELSPRDLLAMLTNRGVLRVTGLPDDARIEFAEWDVRANKLRLLVSSHTFSVEAESFGQHLEALELTIETSREAEAVVQMIRELAVKMSWRGDAKGGGD